MSRKIIPIVIMTMMVAAGLVAAAPAAASSKAPEPAIAAASAAKHVMRLSGQPVTPKTCYPVAGRFAYRYNHDSRYGCATSPERAFQNGTYQEFANGEMDWSPSQGSFMVVSALRYTYYDSYGPRTGIHFEFGSSSPKNYDSWLIRTYFNGQYAGQAECWATGPCDRLAGGWDWRPVQYGHYQFIVEGCDVSSSHSCNEGWTLPVDLQV
jgi:hypothetical protein